MFLLADGGLVLSPSDLANAAACELAVLSNLDGRLGWSEPAPIAADAMLAAGVGAGHGARAGGPRRVPRDAATSSRSRARGTTRPASGPRWNACRPSTLAALASDADVVYQAGFFDGRFTGWADFVVREGGRWAVLDTKLARSVKVTALLQLTAYADQLVAAGIPVTDDVHLILGDRSRSSHRLADLLPLYRERRARLEDLLDEHRAGGHAGGLGRCPLPGVRAVRRLRGAGGRAPGRPPGRRDAVDAARAAGGGRRRHHRPAGGEHRGGARASASRRWPTCAGRRPSRSGRRPRRSRWCSRSSSPRRSATCRCRTPATSSSTSRATRCGRTTRSPPTSPRTGGWSTCSGWSRPDGTFRPFWAHDRAQEKQAFVDFLAYVERAPRRAPGHARLPLRPLRAVGAAPARGPARRRRGRRRPAAARRRPGRPVRDRAPRPARGQQLVLAEEARTALHG